MQKTRIIIAGSEGLIGSELVKYFNGKDNYEVIKLDVALGQDLTKEDFVKSWFKENKAEYLVNLFALNDHGDPKILGGTDLFNISLDGFRKTMEVNVVAMFSVCREFARNEEAKGIINFASTYGLVSPLPHLYKSGQKYIGYSVSKGAVVQLSRHLATHLAPKVRVNCVAPGGIGEPEKQGEEFIKKYSSFTPMGRMMRKDELNKLIEYLCSDGSSYMTGSVLSVDGGWTAW